MTFTFEEGEQVTSLPSLARRIETLQAELMELQAQIAQKSWELAGLHRELAKTMGRSLQQAGRDTLAQKTS